LGIVALTAAGALACGGGGGAHGDAGGGAGGAGGGGADAGAGAGGSGGVGGAGGSGGAGGVDGGGIYPAFAPDLPTVLPGGGDTLATPLAIPIFFSNEDAARITATTDFLARLAGSAYWTTTTGEYGVGALNVAPAIQATDAAPDTIDDPTIAGWVTTAIAAGTLPAPTAGAIYTVYYPVTTTINLSGQVSCVNFGGYHSQTTSAAGQNVVYAVIAGCHSYSARLAPGDSIGDTDFTTGLTTHELIEASTDPLIATGPAYSGIDTSHLAWARYLNGGELADTCEVQPAAFFHEPTIGYVVQRTWSNAAAQAGHDPCPPNRAPVFFNATAHLPVVDARGSTTEAIGIPAGGTATVEVDLASDGPTSGPWTVNAIDYASEHGSGPALSLALDRSTGVNGDKLTLTITVLTADPSGFEGFILESSLGGVRIRNAGLVFQP
jgi:hypothetical protein